MLQQPATQSASQLLRSAQATKRPSEALAHVLSTAGAPGDGGRILQSNELLARTAVTKSGPQKAVQRVASLVSSSHKASSLSEIPKVIGFMSHSSQAGRQCSRHPPCLLVEDLDVDAVDHKIPWLIQVSKAFMAEHSAVDSGGILQVGSESWVESHTPCHRPPWRQQCQQTSACPIQTRKMCAPR